jgi:hypothetical protein
LYSTILVPLGINAVVNKPLPELGMVDSLTSRCFSSNAMQQKV